MREYLASGSALQNIGAAVVACGLATCAIAALHHAEIDLARAAYPHCELRATMPDGSHEVLAMGESGEDCKALAARITRRADFHLPADYRAIWYELIPGE